MTTIEHKAADMTSESIRTSVITYLARFFPAQQLNDDDDIFRMGFVNSMFALQLVNFVEHEFGLEIETEDMELENFRSVQNLVAFVQRKSPVGS